MSGRGAQLQVIRGGGVVVADMDVLRARNCALTLAADKGYVPPSDPGLLASVEVALDQARLKLQPGDPVEVIQALRAIARRLGLMMPSGFELEMDAEIMGDWPEDLFRKAFKHIWETFEYRRMPEVPDFRRHIAEDLAERRKELAALQDLQRRIGGIRKP